MYSLSMVRVSSSTGRTRWRRCSPSLITACSTSVPHPGQNLAVLLNLALQLGQESLILFFRCTMATIPCSKSISLTVIPKASETRQPRWESSLTRSLSLKHSAACSIRSTSFWLKISLHLAGFSNCLFFTLYIFIVQQTYKMRYIKKQL